MGTTVSANDEWIELYNNTKNSLNLGGWRLVAQDGTPKISLSGTISANDFYLLERTDDTTVPNIPADQIYTGALGNTGETLGLYDNFGNLIDSVNCSSGWFAGDNSTKQTMERVDPQTPGTVAGNWQTSQNPGGTPKAKNSTATKINPASQPKPQPETEAKALTENNEIVDAKPQQPAPSPSTQKEEPESNPEIKPEIVYPSGIIINEILPSPKGSDEEEEWIEIFNNNEEEINLFNWKISDIAGKTNTYTFPEITIIKPFSFLVLSRKTTNITLNNSGDGLNLIQPDGKISDSVTYASAPIGQSYNRTENNWFWSDILTPGSPSAMPSPPPVEKNAENSARILDIKNSGELPERQLASAEAQIPKSFSGVKIFLIALIPAVLFGIIILSLKQKIKKANLYRD